MTLAAGKIVRDCAGCCVTLKLYVDCRCVWQTEIHDSKPFRMPDQIIGTEFEVELIGQAAIYEVHLASSMQELIEQ